MIWLACILFANQILATPPDLSPGQPHTFVQALFSKSIFYYLAWYSIMALLFASRREEKPSRLDIAVVLMAVLVNFVPANSANWLATTAAGVYLIAAGRGDAKLRAAGAVLVALACNGFWGPKLFDFFSFYLLRADAALVGSVLALTQPGMGWEGTIVGRPGAHSLVIFAPCSSFHNISLGLLCWVSITKLARDRWARWDWAVAFAICACVVLINAGRLYLMALSPEGYAYWHQGGGEPVIAWATTLAVLGISLLGATLTGKKG